MGAYLYAVRMSFADEMAYAANQIVHLSTSFIRGYVTVAIWWAVLAGQDNTSGEMVIATLRYMILSTLLTTAYSRLPERDITNRLQRGDIARDFLLPINIPTYMWCSAIGKVAAAAIIRVPMSFVVLSLIFGVDWNLDYAGLALGFPIMVFSFYLFFLMNSILDIFSFWWGEIYYLRYVKGALLTLLSGSFVPLWFYPSWLLSVVDALPLKNLYYLPISAILMVEETDAVISELILCLVWCGIGTAVLGLIWTKAKNRVEVYGG